MSKTKLDIGFVRLSDVAPLAVALRGGYFEAQNIDVALQRFSSWAAMRDALGAGKIDAAHMLSPMVVASAAGLGPFPQQFTTSFVFNLNGNAITVSQDLFDEMQGLAASDMEQLPLSASALKTVITKRRDAGAPRLTFAHVFTYSMHAYELRYWLAASGIDPDNDIDLVVTPPTQMVDALTQGKIDGFCVGDPWNVAAVKNGVGRTLITSSGIWSNSPEKVLAVRRDWAGKNEDQHVALIRALLEACLWLDKVDNRHSAAKIVASPEFIDAPLEYVSSSLTGINRQTAGRLQIDIPDFNVFYRYAANFPWRSHAKWILSQMIRWGEAPESVDVQQICKAAFDPRVFRKAAGELNLACPMVDEKTEGMHSHAWLMTEATQPIVFGSDCFIDGRVFKPNEIREYISSFRIRYRKSRLSQSDLEQVQSTPAT